VSADPPAATTTKPLRKLGCSHEGERRLGDVVTDSKKVQRFLHFTLPVVVDSLLYIS
jgi:hypothetical protein